MPAVAEFQYAIHRGRAIAANPDGRTPGPRQECERRELDERAVVGAGRVGAEQVMDHAERLVGNRAALAKVGAECGELRLHPADADAENHSIARKFLDRRDLLCRQHRGPIGDDQHRNAEPDLLGRARDEGQRRKHVEIAAATAFGLVNRDAQMIGDEQRVEAGLLRDSCTGTNRRAIGLRTHVADCDCEFHRCFLRRHPGH